jgi:hypothetical protein
MEPANVFDDEAITKKLLHPRPCSNSLQESSPRPGISMTVMAMKAGTAGGKP